MSEIPDNLLDQLEWMAGETGQPFHREEEHRQMLADGIVSAIESSQADNHVDLCGIDSSLLGIAQLLDAQTSILKMIRNALLAIGFMIAVLAWRFLLAHVQ